MLQNLVPTIVLSRIVHGSPVQGLKFTVQPSSFAEDLDKSKFTPAQYVVENSRIKALTVFEKVC